MKMSDTKTVPIADTGTGHSRSNTKLHTAKSKKSKWVPSKLLTRKRQNSIGNVKPFEEISTTPKQRVEVEELQESRTFTENQKSVEHNCQKKVSNLWRREERRTGTWSQPGSPRGALLQSPNPPSNSRIKQKKIQQQANNVKMKKSDPLMGMSIIIVILIITLIWGRLCAILCTSAWLFFISRYKSESKTNSDSGVVDLDSEEYKKKVVFEGFLERDHRAISL